MKNTLFIAFFATTIFGSCSKENSDKINPDPSAPVTVKYEFTAGMPANYLFAFKKDSVITDEIVNTQAWTKTVTVLKNTHDRVARFSVYPPEEWVGTGTQTNVNIRLSINGILKKDTSGILADFDRAMGITVEAGY